MLTNFQAPRYCIKTLDVLQPSKVWFLSGDFSDSFLQDNWKMLVMERDKDVLEDAVAVNNNHLVLIYLHDVKVVGHSYVWLACIVFVQSVMELHELATGKLIDTFPMEMGCVSEITGKRKQNEVGSFCM